MTHAALHSSPNLDAPGAPNGARLSYWLLNLTHAIIDIFPTFFVVLVLPLRKDLGLTPGQEAFIYAATPIFSGLCQPVLAWLSDKHDSRILGPLGLLVGALCIGSIGFAESFWQLIALQILGVVCTGMYHPIATAAAGQIGSTLFRNGRTQAIGIFIACGMAGQTLGFYGAPVVNKHLGIEHLAWLIPPSVVLAVFMHRITGRTSHRASNHAEVTESFTPEESRRRWRTIGVITAQNCLRFTANVGMFIMFNTWCLGHVTRAVASLDDDAQTIEAALGAIKGEDLAAVFAGYLGGSMTMGMGVSVIVIGRLVKRGHERGPLAFLSFIGAAAMASIGFLGDALIGDTELGFVVMLPMLLAAALSAIGFFATFPIATSLAQRLQPGHTSLVTSLMMGVGWGVSSTCALLAPLFFGGVDIDQAHLLEPWRISVGFACFAALLVGAGCLTVFIPRDLVAQAAEHH